MANEPSDDAELSWQKGRELEFLRSRDGQRMLFLLQGWATGAFEASGAFMASSAISALARALVLIDERDVFLCLDHLVVEKWLVEVTSPKAHGQHRVFVSGKQFASWAAF